MRKRHFLSTALLAIGLIASPALGEEALAWLQDGIGIKTTVHDGGMWTPTGGAVYATDPLTLWQTEGAPLEVPAQPAALRGLLETEQGRAAAMLLQWSDGDVACGEDLSTIGVDTGLAGFLTPESVAALERYGKAHGGHLYVGSYAAQLDDPIPTVPFIVELPDGTRFPVSGSGWGDGGYPVASLLDDTGQMLALYVQFIGGEDWLLPPPCPEITG